MSSELRVVGFVDGDEVYFHIGGAGPPDETAGKGDHAAFAKDDGQAAFAGIALPKGVGGDHAHAPARLEEIKDASVERCAEVGSATVRGIGGFQPVAVLVPEISTDYEATHEGRIAEHHIEAALGKDFRELQRPVEKGQARRQRPSMADQSAV